MLADLLTKPMSGESFVTLRDTLMNFSPPHVAKGASVHVAVEGLCLAEANAGPLRGRDDDDNQGASPNGTQSKARETSLTTTIQDTLALQDTEVKQPRTRTHIEDLTMPPCKGFVKVTFN